MLKFIVNVELHGVRDYLPLHEAMTKRKFKRVIKRADGKTFALPKGQYHYRSDASIEAVVRKVRQATLSVSYDDASILVSQVEGTSRFSKLKRADLGR
ncbi:MAG TPA: hypothetical protein VJT73_17940 [Polyangiaceae bacterium]|nr:hypothetical protein [Polyangiaceae bacterium]